MYIELMSKLKSAFNRGGGIDEKIDSAFSSSSQAAAAKQSFSERVLDSHQKFGSQFQTAQNNPAPKKFGESSPRSTVNEDLGRFDPEFVPERHLDDFDETKNIENFKRTELPPASPRDVARPVIRDDLHELATATPRRNVGLSGSGELSRVIEELEDIRAQNGEILRKIQRIEEKLRR